ncbi:hypothetical protein [Corynebacterium sp. TAE3-ERU2]|uniref:hypothetical protein n=1 Tax=Corynebacterium sp. TAE3-ERU2 TaxID=2849497 RepID=UPI001C458989|nr:hypothetical protein [Corynebacterium sp. TAE3-ERU2]MBV7302920.1 hypothetical protein [Corynebacterium sp. TAE3-ERU2]
MADMACAGQCERLRDDAGVVWLVEPEGCVVAAFPSAYVTRLLRLIGNVCEMLRVPWLFFGEFTEGEEIPEEVEKKFVAILAEHREDPPGAKRVADALGLVVDAPSDPDELDLSVQQEWLRNRVAGLCAELIHIGVSNAKEREADQ